MYSTIVYMYRKYSANYHDVLKYWIYVHEVLQRKLSPCTQPLYFFTGSSAQTIAMYTTIVFMYGRCYSANYRNVLNHVIMYRRCYSANYRHVLNHVFIYVAWCATAQTITIYFKIVFIYKKYSSNFGHCIYVQEVL